MGWNLSMKPGGTAVEMSRSKNGKKFYRNKFVYAAKPALETPGTEGYHAARFKV